MAMPVPVGLQQVGKKGLKFEDSTAMPRQFICLGTRDYILSEDTAVVPEAL